MEELMEMARELLDLESSLEELDTETLLDKRAEVVELLQELNALVFRKVDFELTRKLKQFRNDITVVIALR